MRREELVDLNAFATVAEEQSFTRAAAKLGTSQSALSHTINRLEARVGVRLLARTTRNVAPTEAGERMLRALGPLVTIHQRTRPDRDLTNNHRNLNSSSVSQDAHRNTRSGALEFDIDHCVVQPKLTQYNSFEGRGELWIAEADRSCGRIEFDPKRGLNHQEKRTAGPCLGRTGHRIKRGSCSAASTKAAKQFRQSTQFHKAGGGERRLEYLVHVPLKPIPR